MNNRVRIVKWVFLIVMSLLIADMAWQDAKRNDELIVLCTLHGELQLKGPLTGSPAPQSVTGAVRWIAAAAGHKPNFEILQSEQAQGYGAFAAIYKGKRYIVYDPEEFKLGPGIMRLEDVGTLAHEASHHWEGHTAGERPDKHEQELEADRGAGFALAMIGASQQQALMFPDSLPEDDSDTHPGNPKRRIAVLEGWNDAHDLLRTGGLICKPQWLGEETSIEGRHCRVARACYGGKAEIGLTCRGDDGQWNWQREKS